MINGTVLYGCVCAIVFMFLDYGTGLVKAILQHSVSSKLMREGLGHKFAYVVVLFMAWFIEFESSHINLGFSVPLFVPVVVAISLIEITSILENCVEINPELGNSKILEIFKESNK